MSQNAGGDIPLPIYIYIHMYQTALPGISDIFTRIPSLSLPDFFHAQVVLQGKAGMCPLHGWLSAGSDFKDIL